MASGFPAQAASAGGAGSLPLDPGRAVPLTSLVGDSLSAGQQKVLTAFLEQEGVAYPGRLLVAGVPAREASSGGPAPRGTSQEEKWVHIWPAAEEGASPVPRHLVFLDTQPFRGNWSFLGHRVTLNSVHLTMAVPVIGPQPGVGQGRLTVKVQGTWPTRPHLEVYDEEAGIWVPEPALLGPGMDEDIVMPAAAQAALAVGVHNDFRAALVSSTGTLWLSRKFVALAAPQEVGKGLETRFKPAVAVDGFQRTHLVYRKKGELSHSWEAGGAWMHGTVPDSGGAGTPSLVGEGDKLHAAFVVPGIGVSYGVWQSERWTTSGVLADPSAANPVSLTVEPSGAMSVCYGLAGAVGCSVGFRGVWTQLTPPAAVPGSGAVKDLRLASWYGRVSGIVIRDAPAGTGQVEALSLNPQTVWGARQGLAGSFNFRSLFMPKGKALAAASVSGGGGTTWVSVLADSGMVLLGPGMGSSLAPTGINGAAPPFAFAGSTGGNAFWLYRTSRGIVVRREDGAVGGAPSAGPRGFGPGGLRPRQEAHSAVYPEGDRFVWKEARLAKVRLTVTAPATFGVTAIREAP